MTKGMKNTLSSNLNQLLTESKLPRPAPRPDSSAFNAGDAQGFLMHSDEGATPSTRHTIMNSTEISDLDIQYEVRKGRTCKQLIKPILVLTLLVLNAYSYFLLEVAHHTRFWRLH